MLEILKQSAFQPLPLYDFDCTRRLVYSDSVSAKTSAAIKSLMSYQGDASYGLLSLENEIISTLMIEQIHTSRESVRKILSGAAPEDASEQRIWGMKKGFDFISKPGNRIDAQSLRTLYELVVNPYLTDVGDRLPDGQLYRTGPVSIMSQSDGRIVHQGMDAANLPAAMSQLFDFIDQNDRSMDDLSKASVLHFYLSYLHPYYDGNGRMARMLHLWYLVQSGYPATLFMPFSSLIHKTKNQYYKAFDCIEENKAISGLVDVTPFLTYFNDHIYQHIGSHEFISDVMDRFMTLLQTGAITQKEKELFHFVLSKYGNGEFSTKQLERDFGNCAYATIRSFVLKFSECDLLEMQPYGNRRKYRITPAKTVSVPK